MSKLKELINRLEETNIGFGLWICLALCIIFIRDSLESIVAVNAFPLADSFHLFHVPVFYFSLLLSIILLLHFFTKTEIIKVSRACLIFFPIIILPVTIDFLISLAARREIEYGYIIENVGTNFIQFLNPFFKIAAVPLSVRLEIAIITILSFGYIHLKRNKISLSILGAFLIYSLCVLFGSIPGILTGALAGFLRLLIFLSRHIRLSLSGNLRGVVEEDIVVITQLLLTLLLAVIWFLRYDSKKWKALFDNFRLTRVFHYFLMAILGLTLYFYDVRNTDMFVLIKIAGMLAALFFAFQFSAVVNDIFDVESDRISNKDRPLVAGSLEKSEYLRIGAVYLAFSLLFAFWVSDTCFSITLIFIALYFIYSVPPFRLKRFYPLSSLIIGLEALLAFLLGQLSLETEAAEPSIYPSVLWLVFLAFLLSSNIKDLKDIEGDRQAHIPTLPVMLGEARARTIIAGLVFLSYLIVPLFFYLVFFSYTFMIISIGFGIANFIYIRKQEARERVIFLMYFAYAILLILFFNVLR